MGGFTSLDDMMNQITTNGKFYRADWNKNWNAVGPLPVTQWGSFLLAQGSPAPNSLLGTGTNLAFQALSDAVAGNGGIPHGGNTGNYKHILNASVWTPSNAPAIMQLVDVLRFYPVTTVTTTTQQTLDNTVTLPRYTTGVGVQATILPSTALGTGSPTVTMTYTNSDGVSGRVTPTPLPIFTGSAAIDVIPYSGNGQGKYGANMPLAAGDKGIRSIQNFTLSSSCISGVFNIVLYRPLFTIPLIGTYVGVERDFVNQLPSLPRVYDGACLNWLMFAGTTFYINVGTYGHIDFGWS